MAVWKPQEQLVVCPHCGSDALTYSATVQLTENYAVGRNGQILYKTVSASEPINGTVCCFHCKKSFEAFVAGDHIYRIGEELK